MLLLQKLEKPEKNKNYILKHIRKVQKQWRLEITKISEERIFQSGIMIYILLKAFIHSRAPRGEEPGLILRQGHCCDTEINKAFDGFREMEWWKWHTASFLNLMTFIDL